MRSTLLPLAAALCSCPLFSFAQGYTIQELPPLQGHLDSGAFSLNDAGQAAGYSDNTAIIWTGGVPQNIQTLPGEGVAFGINSSGQAAGDISPKVSDSGAFFWSGSTMTRIVLAGGFVSEAYAINDAGAVICTGGNTGGFIWRAGSVTNLSPLPGENGARPLAINNLGVVGGTSAGPLGVRPVVWSSPSSPLLISVPGGSGLVYGLNNVGDAVGSAGTFSTKPFVWSANKGTRMLPLPPGASRGDAWAINDNGVIVGDAGQAVVWKPNASGEYSVELVEPGLVGGAGWSDLSLYGINRDGKIAGEGALNGSSRGFILTPQDAAPLSLKIKYVDRDVFDADWTSVRDWVEGIALFAGRTSGDLVEMSVAGITADMQALWSAEKTGGETVSGPAGNTWRMNAGDFIWPPGQYVVRCQIKRNGAEVADLELPLRVGWRTDEYLLVGQVRPINDYVVDPDREDAIKNALISSYKLGDSYLAKDARSIMRLLPVQKNVLAWTAFQFIKWGWDGSTGAPQFVRLPGVSTKERLWMVQTLLDEYPDNFELPDSLSASELTTLRAQRSYRMFGRTQFRYFLGSSGSIEQSSVVAIRNECDNGPTKFAYLGDFLQGSITVKGVEVDFSGNLSQSFIASEPLPGNGAITIGADSRALSFYFGGRVGLEGRVPNYALFSRDAPFIFTEMIFALGADGRDTGSRIRFSVNKTWSPSGTTGTAHFNEIRIYSRDYGTGGTSFTRVAPVFEIAGQLDAFIQSGDRTWPGAAPLPEIR